AARHCLARILRQARQTGLELTQVGVYRPERGGQVEDKLDVRTEQAPQQLDAIGEHRVDLDPRRPQLLTTRQRQQPPRQLRAAPRRLECLADDVAQFLIAASVFAREPEIGDDNVQQIVELMRQAACEIADRLGFLDLVEPLVDPSAVIPDGWRNAYGRGGGR